MKFKSPTQLIPFLVLFFLSINVIAKEKTFIRDYTYRAGEADSKISARSVALAQLKQLLLEELGSYVYSNIVLTTKEDKDLFKQVTNSQIISASSSIAKTEIVEEEWSGLEYYIKAKISINEESFQKQLEQLFSNREEILKLEQLQHRTDSLFREIAVLKKKLEQSLNAKERQEILEAYTALSREIGAGQIEQPRIEVVFVLDATGSMGGMIANAKDKIWAIATTMAQTEPAPELSIGLIAFRDIGDAYVTRPHPLTTNLDDLYANLLEIKASGGGDQPESVNQALSEAIFGFQWNTNPNTLRMVYLIGDSPPHMDYLQDIKYKESCEEAVKKDIVINTIQCGLLPNTKMVWNEIASLSGGEYLNLNQSGNNFAVTTPFDADLAKKARELDKTRVYYGAQNEAEQHKQEELSDEIYSKSKTEEVARRGIYNATTVAGKSSFLGQNELIDKYERGEINLNTIKDEELPAEMRGLSEAERAAYLKKKSEERKKLQTDIIELNKKRSEYLEGELKQRSAEADGSFNNQFYKVFKKQAAAKNYNAPKNVSY